MENKDKTKFIILASGNGSNAENIIHEVAKHSATQVSAVITDNPKAGVIKRCQRLGIRYEIVNYKSFENRMAFEGALKNLIKDYHADWVLLAGFMKILSSDFIENYFDPELQQARIVNIHPSLLPAYKGLNAYERAFADRVTETGVTLHFVNAEVDEGDILFQEKIAMDQIDSLENLKEIGFQQEFKCYQKFIHLFNNQGQFLWKQ